MTDRPSSRGRWTAALTAVLVGWSGSSGLRAAPAGEMGALWREYPGAPGLPVAFAYPASWRLAEERGPAQEPYVAARLLGPRNIADSYTCMVVVRSVPAGHGWTPEQGVEALVARFGDRPFEQVRVTSRRTEGSGPHLVREVTVAYTIPAVVADGLAGVPVPVRLQALFLEQDGFVYEISYSADAVEFPVYRRLFEQMLESLRFTDAAGPGGCAGPSPPGRALGPSPLR